MTGLADWWTVLATGVGSFAFGSHFDSVAGTRRRRWIPLGAVLRDYPAEWNRTLATG